MMNNKKIRILTGEKHSGKTTAIQQWIAGKNNVVGVLSPIIQDMRHFQLIPSQEVFLMESMDEKEPTYAIGRYCFSVAAFEKAINYLLARCTQNQVSYLVIDEIGPLELQGEGFHELLMELIQNRHSANYELLLVIREGITTEFITHYGLLPEDCTMLQKEALELLNN